MDNLHFNFRDIDGYNKPFNFVISEREAGKSTAFIFKMYNAWKKDGSTSIVLRRRVVDITEIYIRSIEAIINKFTDDNVILEFKKTDISKGTMEVYIKDKLFFVLFAMSAPMQRVKSLMVPKLRYLFFDEFIVNLRLGEHYIASESFKFKELYNTFQRECDSLKCYFLGNPYSMYNCYFADFGVDITKLESGKIYTAKNFAIQCFTLPEELREQILKKNPLYTFDESYKKYAFFGQAINDVNITLVTEQPKNFKLHTIFKYSGKYINCWKLNNPTDKDKFSWWVNVTDSYEGTRRSIICMNFNDLAMGCMIPDRGWLERFIGFKNALMIHDVAFQTVEANYLVETIFPNI